MSSRLPASTGSVSSQIDPATSIDQAKAGTRRRLMPSGRSDSTVVTTQMAAASSERITMIQAA